MEGANVVVINKIDLVSDSQRHELENILKSLNPLARLLPSSYGRIDLDHVLGTGLFSESQDIHSVELVGSREQNHRRNGGQGVFHKHYNYSIH